MDSSAPGDPHRDILATVAADPVAGGLGLFFYRQQGGDPCQTTFRGRTGRPGGPYGDTGPLAGPFPALAEPGTGSLGHYVKGARRSRPGTLLVSWAQPVATAAPCLSCQGQDWSVAVLAAEVVP